MSGQRLWSPWRMAYINASKLDAPGEDPSKGDPSTQDAGADPAGADGAPAGCVFCDLPAQGADRDADNHILGRGEHSFVILNAFPYNPGHLMVMPFRHVADYLDLTAAELAETQAFTRTAVAALRAVSNPQGFNLGFNLGTVAGAGIAAHIHQHVVPRWGGDTNFMPVVGQTKVLPELLSETRAKLQPHFVDGPTPAPR